MAVFVELVLNGLTIGAVYALMALGFTLVWRTARTVNLARGELFTAGAYATLAIGTFSLARHAHWPLWAAVLSAVVAAIVVGGLLGIGIDLSIFRPLRQANELTPLLCSLGASSVLQNVYFLIFGSRDRSIPVQLPTGGFVLGGARIAFVQVVIFAIAAVLVVCLTYLVRYTKLGRAIRAVASDGAVARLMGVPSNSIITWVFALSACLGAVGGVLVAMYYGIASPFMGFSPAIKGLAAAVVGGFGSIPGAVAGGFLIGITEALGSGYLSSAWSGFFSYGILILVIVAFPRGMMSDA